MDEMTARPAFPPHNRDQRVPDRRCARCGGPLFRARRGPVPRWCPPCDGQLRRRRQLRAYLRSASRIAGELALPAVAVLADEAVGLVDQAEGAG